MHKVVTDIAECERLWNKYSPKNKIWDEWEVAKAFYDEKDYELHFIELDNGLIPLYKYHEKYFWFGEGFPEMRTFWFDIDLLPVVIDIIPRPLIIYDMTKETYQEVIKKFPEYEKYFQEKDYRYYLDIENSKIEDYLNTFSSKHKKNLLYDIRKLKEKNLELIWEELEHIEDFVKFNIARFGQESDLTDEDFQNEMRRFLKVVQEMGIMHTLTVKVDGKVEGVEIAALHDNRYYILNGGYNREVKNLGKLIIYEHILNAFKLNAKEVDLLVGDTGWKQLWNFTPDDCYTFKLE